MNTMLENLWNEYFAELCATIDTEAERVLLKKSIEIHQKINEFLTAEQRDVMEEYIDLLYEMQDSFLKKAFFKGCNFACSFLGETSGKF